MKIDDMPRTVGAPSNTSAGKLPAGDVGIRSEASKHNTGAGSLPAGDTGIRTVAADTMCCKRGKK